MATATKLDSALVAQVEHRRQDKTTGIKILFLGKVIAERRLFGYWSEELALKDFRKNLPGYLIQDREEVSLACRVNGIRFK